MSASKRQRDFFSGAVSLVAVGFGLLTIKAGGSVLFGDEAARLAAGDYVPLVLWFNFLAGFAYVIAGVGLWRRQRWAAWLAVVIAAATILVLAGFGAYVYSGGAYEQRTVVALVMRALIWAAIAAYAWRFK